MTDDELIPLILSAAVAAAGPRGSNEGAWRGKINTAIPAIAAMINEGSRPWRIAEQVLGAKVFTCRYVSYEVEASSTRCVVTIETDQITDKKPDGRETIRTHRTDSAQGRAMQAKLDHLSEGDDIVVWKAMEKASDDVKVRVLVHLEARPKFGKQPPSTSHHERPPRPSGPVDDRALVVSWKTATEDRLNDYQMSFLHDEMGKAGLAWATVTADEWRDKVRPLARKAAAIPETEEPF